MTLSRYDPRRGGVIINQRGARTCARTKRSGYLPHINNPRSDDSPAGHHPGGSMNYSRNARRKLPRRFASVFLPGRAARDSDGARSPRQVRSIGSLAATRRSVSFADRDKPKERERESLELKKKIE